MALSNQQSQIKFHKAHDDPSDDTIFTSNDGWSFRASSHKLARISKVFESMKSTASNPSSDPIDLDVTQQVAHIFLSAINAPYAPIPPSTIDEILAVIALIDKWDCAGIETSIQQGIEVIVPNDPWKAFFLASQMDRVDIGKLALSHFSTAIARQLNWNKLTTLPLAWHHELLRCLLSGGSLDVSSSEKDEKRGKKTTRDPVFRASNMPSRGAILARLKETEDVPEDKRYGDYTFNGAWNVEANSRALARDFNPHRKRYGVPQESNKRPRLVKTSGP